MKPLSYLLGSRLHDKVVRKLGLIFKTHVKIRKLSGWSSEDLRTASILNKFGITMVIDIGANVGQFAEALLDYGYSGKIISFEPTFQAHQLISRKSAGIQNWTVAERCALGDSDDTVTINVSKNSVFSSIKNIRNQYAEQNKESQIVSSEVIKMFRLDTLIGKYFSLGEHLFLKIDTQGFEQEVLNGASELLKYVQGIKIEAPLLPIYEKANWDIKEMLNFFSHRGFRCISISEVSVNKKTGIVYEVDLILVKENLLGSLQ